MRSFHHLTLSLLAFCLFGASLAAQSTNASGAGTLSGTVVDSDNETLIGAYVSLEGTDYVTTTDVLGAYTLEKIPYGQYTLKVSYVASADFSQSITVESTQLTIDVRLEDDVQVLEAATVVEKTAARAQQERAIQIESVELRQVVSRVKDVGEVIERLPGVNVRGSGSFGDQVDISLNGLNGTAVRTYLDGLPLEFIFPQLTINNIPVNSIARIDVYKGVVPIDVGTDALGGAVNVITEQRSFNDLRASYSFGSFNTHQAALSGNYKIKEGVSIGGNFNYNYSDNNYTMEAFVFEDNERREIERFHDAYELLYGSVHLDVRGKKWADRFRVSANISDFYKEVQNGAVIGNTAFGSVFYDGGGIALSGLYEKALTDKLQLYTNTAYSDIDLVFADTTADVYSWSGAILTRRPNNRGELSLESLSDRNFSNLANRFNLRWSIGPKDELLLSNIVANQSTLGRDEVRPIERDVLARKQTLFKDVLGLQYQRKMINNRLLFSLAAKLYYYELDGVDPNALTDVFASGTDYGYYATAKYDFSERFFVRASYENALRVPTFTQFFGNGTNIRSNLTLQPENSNNFNLGLSYASPRQRDLRVLVSANGFTRAQQDLIFPNANTFQRYENADNANTLGVESSIKFWFRDALRLDVNATRLRQEYGEITSLTQAGSLEGTDFPNVPKWFYNARLTYTKEGVFGKRNTLSVYTQYKYVDQFNYLNVSGTFDPASYVPEQTRVDVGLSLSLLDRKYTIAFNANNIFDAEVFDNFSVPRPGRNFNVRLGYQLTDF